MREWLTASLLQSAEDLTEELEGYILGRGIPQLLMEELRLGSWAPQASQAPDVLFGGRHGDRGEKRAGWLSVPFWGPRGNVLGVEFRRWDGTKEITEHRLPDSKWSPVFIGLTPSVLREIWGGADVWLVEGLFDLAITHVLPPKNVALACGTARVSRAQVAFLQRFLKPSARVFVAFDEDETGRKHALGYRDERTNHWVPGAVQILDKVGVSAQVVRYFGGKDPGVIWERGGRPALASAFHFNL